MSQLLFYKNVQSNVVIFYVCLYFCFRSVSADETEFEKAFIFGAGSSAYQVEGAWNVADKGENSWDVFTHENPGRILDRSNGDVATNSYYLYRKDIEALKDLGANAYKMSISWSRLLPNGNANSASEDGKRYYNALINELLANGIEPIVTLYHWDTPRELDRIGGWSNKDIIAPFLVYAKYAFERFGDRVKTWMTFNEINIICLAAYGRDLFAPGLNRPGEADYQCAHNMLLAHALTYRMYKSLFAANQKGKIGLSFHLFGYTLINDDAESMEAANVAFEFTTGWILSPILSKNGDYPQAMRTLIKMDSAMNNLSRSRLPEFNYDERKLLKGSIDFLGITHYSSALFTFGPVDDTNLISPLDLSYFLPSDLPCFSYRLNQWKYRHTPIYSIAPESFLNGLLHLKRKYGNQEIIIAETGFPHNIREGGDTLNDFSRVEYLNKYLDVILRAKNNGMNIKAYLHWSLTDNFEWCNGYDVRFGLYGVNFTSPTKERIGRLSSRVLKNIIKTRKIDFSYRPIIANDFTII